MFISTSRLPCEQGVLTRLHSSESARKVSTRHDLQAIELGFEPTFGRLLSPGDFTLALCESFHGSTACDFLMTEARPSGCR